MDNIEMVMEEAAKLLFKGPLRVSLTTDDDRRGVDASAEEMYWYKNNWNDDGTPRRTKDEKLRNAARGFSTEKGAALMLGLPYSVPKVIPRHWKFDLRWNGLRLEVKSVEPQWIRQVWKTHQVLSLSRHATKTVVGSIAEGKIDLLIGGTSKCVALGEYDVWFEWIINPASFAEAWRDSRCRTTSSGGVEFVKFGRDPEHRKPGASLWVGEREQW